MRIFAITICAAANLLVMGAALAEPTATASSDSPNDPSRIVCKSTPAPTGTRLGGGRTCRTQREWEEIQKRDQDELKLIQEKGLHESKQGG